MSYDDVISGGGVELTLESTLYHFCLLFCTLHSLQLQIVAHPGWGTFFFQSVSDQNGKVDII